MKAAIQFKQVNYTIDHKEILKQISGSFYDGEITTLVGPSGAGKTTLLKLCNGLLSPQSGEMYLYERRIEEYDPVELRRKVGMALQSAPMIDGNVYKNLSLPLELQGQQLPKDRAKALLEDVGLTEDLLQQDIRDLSGGQRQKVSIARTLVNRPQILLLDEITSSLDFVSQKEIEELIVSINRKYHVTIVWITHNLQQALTVGTYTWVMMAGEIIESGGSELLRSPRTERVRQFVKGELQ
ncbi:phosphate ABC transporter ATP-binding protein [Bacillus rubiinfantis]|uniref:ABC transporter ATP-binding protein n=1 Tax=Bacillus rubiinfantis TaxID=1499680 RepID=UPI0005AB03C0|nr:phosphate ABC transporter ATP-binding protein [Bacillus rubiinfantis]